MGHLRVGVLPKTNKWRAIVSDIAAFSNDAEVVGKLVGSTTSAASDSMQRLQNDLAVRRTFVFLLALIEGSKQGNTKKVFASLGIPDPGTNPTPLRIVQSMSK